MRYLWYLFIFAIGILCIWGISIFLRHRLSRLVDRRIAAYQNDLIARHCDEVENIYRQMRGWRHDYHNHIQAMKAHVALDQLAELNEYLGNLDADLTSVDTVLKTGNVMVDAILNSKLSLAKAKNIRVHAKATVSADLAISEIDLCVILGNLLDNAIEACMKLSSEQERFIRLYIGRLKDQFYVSVTNSTGGEIKKSGFLYLTTKNSDTHGFGLMRVDKIVQKYGGYVNRQNETGVFATEVMLPLLEKAVHA